MTAWLILGLIIGFAAFVGFILAHSQGGYSGDEERQVTWWPDKWLRLFWLISPFIITVAIAVYGANHGMETGALWAFFGALVIIQAVVGGMFGFHFDLVSSIICGIFIAVEILALGGILLFAVFEYPEFLVWYLILGILAISAGTVLAAWLGSIPARRGGREN